jgi:filamentous hemagglutinin
MNRRDPLGLDDSICMFNKAMCSPSLPPPCDQPKTRPPDFISFNINVYVFSVFGSFASTGNAYVGGGVNFTGPNPLNLDASVNLGWLNTTDPTSAQIDNFLVGYSGGLSGAYMGYGGGEVVSPGNGTATVIGVGAGESYQTTYNGSGMGHWGYAVRTGYTGITW